MYSFNKKERWALAGLLILLVPSLLVNLGIVPLYVEEPRRATVAMEMILRGNWLVPTINGEFYYLKPPVFNWILASAFTLSGTQSEFITRLPTVISLLAFGLVIFWTGKKYVSFSFGVLTAFLFLTASGNLFFNSLLAEIDIFYSLVTYSGLVILFHLYQRKRFLLLFILVYLLGAVGTLTKGLPSLLFTGLSLLVFFTVNKEFRRLFSSAHLAGILVFLLITGGYFLAYSRHGDAVRYLLSLTVESGKRLSGETFWDYLQHMFLYPLDTLMNLIPASFLLIFAWRKSFLQDIKASPFLRFALLMLAVHFPVYWLPPGGRQRYIIMLYPFVIQILSYFFLLYFNREKARFRIFSTIIILATGLSAAACLIPLFSNQTGSIAFIRIISILSSLILVAGFIFHLRKPQFSIFILIFSLIVLRFVFDLAVLPVRAREGVAPENMKAALELNEKTKGEQVCILPPTYFPMQTVYYFERERKDILPVCREIPPGVFFIAEKYLFQDYKVYREISTLEMNPLLPFSDPFSGDDRRAFSGSEYKVHKEFTLQKRKYQLLMFPDF